MCLMQEPAEGRVSHVNEKAVSHVNEPVGMSNAGTFRRLSLTCK